MFLCHDDLCGQRTTPGNVSFPSIMHVGPGDQTEVDRLGSKHLYNLSHHMGPEVTFKVPVIWFCSLEGWGLIYWTANNQIFFSGRPGSPKEEDAVCVIEVEVWVCSSYSSSGTLLGLPLLYSFITLPSFLISSPCLASQRMVLWRYESTLWPKI